MSRFKFPSSTNAQNNNTKEFQFSATKYKPSPTRELPSISYLRSKLIQYTFCQPNDFYDLPQTILIFTVSDDDDTYIIPGVIKSRGRIINYKKEYSNIPKNSIVYQASPKKLKSVLLTFLEQIIKPRFRDAFNRIESEFTNTIVINHQLDDAIQYNTNLSVSSAQQIKRYADYQMMRGEHKVAYSLYHQLLLHFPTEKTFLSLSETQGIIGSLFFFNSQSTSNKSHSIPTAFTSSVLSYIECIFSVTFCAACCDIIIGEVTSETVKLLQFLIDKSLNIQQRLFISLLIFWVLPRIGKPSPDILLEFLDYASITCETDAASQNQIQQLHSHNMAKSNSFTSIPILSSIHASFSLNNLASTIYRQISSDDLSSQLGENNKNSFKLTFPIIVEPFLHEQIIQFYSRRQLPFQYFLLARRFDMINQKENYVRCLWNSFITLMNSEGGPQYHNCEFCLAYLIEKIVNVLLREKNFLNQPKSDSNWFLADYIGYLMRFDNIQRLPVFASFFSMWDSHSKFYKTGFIRASVLSFSTMNPQFVPPRKFKGNWRTLSKKLYGFTNKSNSQFGFFFFDSNDEDSVCDTVSCGDEIRVRVSITNKAAHFSVGETWLKTRGDVETTKVSVGSKKKSEVVYLIKPIQKSGLIHIDGLNILWVNNVNLFTHFQRPLCFRCLSNAPSLKIEEVSYTSEVFAGEASMLRLVLHVGSVSLTSLALLIEAVNDETHLIDKRSSLSSFTILSPQTRSIGGQFFFGPIDSNKDVAVNIMITSTSVGFHSHWLFFSFTSEEGSSRYAYYNYKVSVIEPPESESYRVAMFPSFFNLYDEHQIEVSLKPVSDSKKFQLSLSNISKKDVNDICIEFLERKLKSEIIINHEYKSSLQNELMCSFASDFGSYFGSHENDKIYDSQTYEYSSSFEKFIVYGFTKKKFALIPARKSVAFSFGFESLDHETYPYLRISFCNKNYMSDMSVIMHHYDIV